MKKTLNGLWIAVLGLQMSAAFAAEPNQAELTARTAFLEGPNQQIRRFANIKASEIAINKLNGLINLFFIDPSNRLLYTSTIDNGNNLMSSAKLIPTNGSINTVDVATDSFDLMVTNGNKFNNDGASSGRYNATNNSWVWSLFEWGSPHGSGIGIKNNAFASTQQWLHLFVEDAVGNRSTNLKAVIVSLEKNNKFSISDDAEPSMWTLTPILSSEFTDYPLTRIQQIKIPATYNVGNGDFLKTPFHSPIKKFVAKGLVNDFYIIVVLQDNTIYIGHFVNNTPEWLCLNNIYAVDNVLGAAITNQGSFALTLQSSQGNDLLLAEYSDLATNPNAVVQNVNEKCNTINQAITSDIITKNELITKGRRLTQDIEMWGVRIDLKTAIAEVKNLLNNGIMLGQPGTEELINNVILLIEKNYENIVYGIINNNSKFTDEIKSLIFTNELSAPLKRIKTKFEEVEAKAIADASASIAAENAALTSLNRSQIINDPEHPANESNFVKLFTNGRRYDEGIALSDVLALDKTFLVGVSGGLFKLNVFNRNKRSEGLISYEYGHANFRDMDFGIDGLGVIGNTATRMTEFSVEPNGVWKNWDNALPATNVAVADHKNIFFVHQHLYKYDYENNKYDWVDMLNLPVKDYLSRSSNKTFAAGLDGVIWYTNYSKVYRFDGNIINNNSIRNSSHQGAQSYDVDIPTEISGSIFHISAKGKTDNFHMVILANFPYIRDYDGKWYKVEMPNITNAQISLSGVVVLKDNLGNFFIATRPMWTRNKIAPTASPPKIVPTESPFDEVSRMYSQTQANFNQLRQAKASAQKAAQAPAETTPLPVQTAVPPAAQTTTSTPSPLQPPQIIPTPEPQTQAVAPALTDSAAPIITPTQISASIDNFPAVQKKDWKAIALYQANENGDPIIFANDFNGNLYLKEVVGQGIRQFGGNANIAVDIGVVSPDQGNGYQACINRNNDLYFNESSSDALRSTELNLPSVWTWEGSGFVAVAVGNRNNIFVVKSNGYVWRTENQGDSWSQVLLQNNNPLIVTTQNAAGIHSLHNIAAGADGTLWYIDKNDAKKVYELAANNLSATAINLPATVERVIGIATKGTKLENFMAILAEVKAENKLVGEVDYRVYARNKASIWHETELKNMCHVAISQYGTVAGVKFMPTGQVGSYNTTISVLKLNQWDLPTQALANSTAEIIPQNTNSQTPAPLQPPQTTLMPQPDLAAVQPPQAEPFTDPIIAARVNQIAEAERPPTIEMLQNPTPTIYNNLPNPQAQALEAPSIESSVAMDLNKIAEDASRLLQTLEQQSPSNRALIQKALAEILNNLTGNNTNAQSGPTTTNSQAQSTDSMW